MRNISSPICHENVIMNIELVYLECYLVNRKYVAVVVYLNAFISEQDCRSPVAS